MRPEFTRPHRAGLRLSTCLLLSCNNMGCSLRSCSRFERRKGTFERALMPTCVFHFPHVVSFYYLLWMLVQFCRGQRFWPFGIAG